MLRLRPYKRCDAKYIVEWVEDETAFRKWCADKYEKYPINAEDINAHYEAYEECDDFFEMTAYDEEETAGHLIMRFTNSEKTELRFGFIIVNAKKRGKGYGREMLLLAAKYAFEILKVKKISLAVFENNEAAYRCYKAVGFKESGKIEYVHLLGEDWKYIEMQMTKEEMNLKQEI